MSDKMTPKQALRVIEREIQDRDEEIGKRLNDALDALWDFVLNGPRP